MTTETKFLGIILIITIVLLAGGVFLLSNKGASQAQTVMSQVVSQIDYSKGQKIGSDSAKVRLVEFFDFQCPACLTAHAAVTKLRSNYSADQLQIIYRHFPLPQHIHAHARQAANLAEAAAEQGKFWEMSNKLFETQNQWANLTDANQIFLSLAKESGLDEDKIKQVLENDVYQAKIDADIAEGKRLGVDATPAFFLNGHKLNLQNFADLGTVIVQELKK